MNYNSKMHTMKVFCISFKCMSTTESMQGTAHKIYLSLLNSWIWSSGWERIRRREMGGAGRGFSLPMHTISQKTSSLNRDFKAFLNLKLYDFTDHREWKKKHNRGLKARRGSWLSLHCKQWIRSHLYLHSVFQFLFSNSLEGHFFVYWFFLNLSPRLHTSSEKLQTHHDLNFTFS